MEEIKAPKNSWAYLKADPSIKLRIFLPQADGQWKFRRLLDNQEAVYSFSDIEIVPDSLATGLEKEYTEKFNSDELSPL